MIRKCSLIIVFFMIFSVSTVFGQRQPSRLELDYGTSYKLQKYNQILNPEAEKNLEPVTGLDGLSAKEGMDRSTKSFKEPSKSPVYNFSIGGEGEQ